MEKRLSWLHIECSAFNLEIEEEFSFCLSDGTELTALARIKGGGQEKGMLIFADYGDVEDYVSLISDTGFGFCIFDEPSEASIFDLEASKKMYRDWGFEIENAQ